MLASWQPLLKNRELLSNFNRFIEVEILFFTYFLFLRRSKLQTMKDIWAICRDLRTITLFMRTLDRNEKKKGEKLFSWL